MAPATSSSQEAFDVSQHLGLVNLGNTCFFNSVLQATSATRALHSLFHPWGDLALPEAANDSGMTTASLGSRPVNRRRIPALLLTDEEAKRPIIPPLSEVQADELFKLLSLSNSFRFTLEKTWKEPSKATNVRPASHSPKALLKLLARKFDQFGHYEQQDAHELLRLLLDAMRMEEMDFIKKIRPRGPREAQRQISGHSLRSDSSSMESLSATEPSDDGTDGLQSEATSGPSSSRSSQFHDQGDVTPMASNSQHHLISEGDMTIRELPNSETSDSTSAGESSDDLVWEDMMSLVDVLWGGQLASMVVCEGCRHVSHTYEDFLDLSLPLRPEDAATASLRERRANRMRLMTDRWRKPGTPVSSVRSAKSTNPSEERDTILKQTLRAEVASDKIAAAEGAPTVASDRLVDGAVSADEDSHTPGSTSWSAWASTLGRSRSARPASTAPVKSVTPTTVTDKDTIDMPDIASMALTPESSASCSVTGNEEVLRRELARAVEAKSKGSKDLLTALSNASRAHSRAGSRNRDGVISRTNSPGSEKPPARAETSDAEHSQHHLLAGLLHHHSAHRSHREPSKRAQYIAKAFGEPGQSAPTTASSSLSGAGKHTFRSKVRADQATTGLAVALRAFTTSEVLSEENAFNCKRCWRRLNPAKGAERERLRRRRARKGKNPSGSEDSEDDDGGEAGEDEDLATAGGAIASYPAASSIGPVKLVAPKPQRAATGLLNPLSLGSSEDEASDAEAIVKSKIVVGEHLDAPGPSAIDLLEEGARTPGSRRSSTQPPESQFFNISRNISGGLVSGAHPAPTSTSDQQGNAADVQHDINAARSVPADEIPRLLGGSSSSLGSSRSVQSGEPSMDERPLSPGSSASADQPASMRARAASSAGSAVSQPDRDVSESGNDSDASSGSANHKSSHTGNPRMLSTSSIVRPATADSVQSLDKTKMPPPSSRAIQRQQPKRSQQSIPRRALKRYLISSFPPILVFHLKRFQANTSTRSTSFFSSSGNSTFKKIDDVVTYPEWLDMAEWMAPPREEYDRHGNLKETSDPRVWEAYHKSSAERSTAHQHVATSDESPDASLTLTNDSTGLKRKPSRWSRTFSRGPSGSSTNSASGLPAPIPSPSQSRVTSPALGQAAFRSHSGEHEAAGSSGPSSMHSTPSPLYRLYSVVAHHGTTMHGGHYTSYVLSDRCAPAAGKKGRDNRQNGTGKEGAANGDAKAGRLSAEHSTSRPHQPTDDQRQWVHCSDTVVKPSTLEQVLRCKDAYMVWYERVA
ncbi:peptidase C19, ubiquitin carboxyl-terminal hydrolase 2 [Microstroma glucosiphilum]|uniref:ubiquitinyl hydrolase 1 n=1 Tax=Pseudomicrostroma glucosiphilum TaxID=1684307 RepID=A0A316UD28_9BASI|nr:peptidase C19, ubiquitin carboxyl-terminal hydrolase 2 [Pseudomicrostroma glucosiphilum]PWN23106.1 peptidase C19, ubiquitin carboxyl-terminal hydrolase 2 [Pseudomicrostroma glucosiphilum]